MNEKIDSVFLEYCTLHDEFIQKYSSLSDDLRNGHFQLAKARYTLGTTLSPLSFDMGMKSTTFVEINCSGDHQTCDCTNCLKIRKGTTAFTTAVAESTSETPERPGKNPIQWYGGLPSLNLRQAQQNFSSSFEKMVELAQLKHKLIHLQHLYNQLLSQKST